MGSHRPTFGIALVTIMLIFAACQRPAEVGSTPDSGPISNSTPMRIVTDDLNRRILVPTQSRRVVSTAPSVTEMIFAVGAGDRLVGVTTFCDYPEEAKAIAKIGDTMNPNIESIVALKPDIVFVSTASQIEAFMKTFEANGIAVYVTNPTSFENIMVELAKLGKLFGTEEDANRLLQELSERELAICEPFVTCADMDGSALVEMVPVFVQISKEPLFTIGRDSFLNELITEAGGRSVTDSIETAYPKLSKETAVAFNPEVIILSDSPDNQQPNDAFRNSRAVKSGRVYKINADIISRPGPRLVDALEQIAKLLHPDKFE